LKAGISPVSLYNFGQPRVGDKGFASLSSATLPTFRVTHYQDVVPHIPLSTGMDFYHACTEEFEDKDGSVRTCKSSASSYCEDPSCADQFPISQTNVDDHLIYLGLPVHCENVSR
jgi:hypothetical protein